ncbi:MAG: hypothetical protein IIZ67_02650 [Bacilli bacterium]|nr:hypothetical protein [Bacilli bacterium]
MNNKNSAIILCKDINLDREYINVLTYTENDMVTLCQNKAVASASNYTFIRQDRNEIKVNFPYATCLQCNYMAFQNPNYSNKWFFAFIDEVSYISDNATRISFTVDEHATWYDYWDAKPCFVIREHVADDTIGLHTVPENLERGDYIINDAGAVSTTLRRDSAYICIGVSFVPDNTLWQTPNRMYGGIFSGLILVVFDQNASADKFIKAYAKMGKSDAIVTMYMIPYSVALAQQLDWQVGSYDNITDIRFALLPSSPAAVKIEDNITYTTPSTLNGYTPKNNKLFTFPYNFLSISNNCGTEVDFHYEDFINNTPAFRIFGMETPNCPAILTPKNYKKFSIPTSGGVDTINDIFYNYGIPAGKFPSCSWQTDLYTNWMTQNGMNILGLKLDAPTSKLVGGSIEAILGAAALNAEGIGSGIGTMLATTQEVYRHQMQSPTLNGQLGVGDLAFARDQLVYSYYKLSIRAEYARIIDDFLSRYGYKVNILKLPNMISRTYWNYIQIGTEEEIGYSNNKGSVPAKSMDRINKIYRNGVTMWHNHDNIGNYSLNNTIVST